LLRDEAVIQEQPEQSGLTERYVEESVRFLRENPDRPFFLYLAHLYVHLPLYVPDRFLRESKNGRYGAAVACVDWALDVIMTELRALGLDENTLVIFTSDNGSRCRGEGGSNAPLRGTKATTWEGGQRVPCILHWPARIPAGTVCKGLSASLDFLPTFAALAGVPMVHDRRIDGHDLSPMLFSGQAADSPRETFFYYMGSSLHAVRKGKWKLHLRRDGQPAQDLYDLESDIAESHRVSDDHPAIVADLLQEAATCRLDLGDSATGVTGRNLRPTGRVANPVPLTRFQPGHPYIVAEYDLKERG
jgi:arylsulfatase A-like enzyme